MNRIITILTVGFQISLTFIAVFHIYMIFALLDNEFGLDGLVVFFVFQPILAIVMSISTIIACLLIGLPIRLNKKLNHWWTTNFYISIIGTVCGLTLILLALLPGFEETVTGCNYFYNVKLMDMSVVAAFNRQ